MKGGGDRGGKRGRGEWEVRREEALPVRVKVGMAVRVWRAGTDLGAV